MDRTASTEHLNIPAIWCLFEHLVQVASHLHDWAGEDMSCLHKKTDNGDDADAAKNDEGPVHKLGRHGCVQWPANKNEKLTILLLLRFPI